MPTFILNKTGRISQKTIEYLSEKVASIAETQIHTPRLTLARALVALNTLITLLFTNWAELFPQWYMQLYKPQTIFDKMGIFYLLRGNIEVAVIIAIIILVCVIAGLLPMIFSVLHFWVALSYFRSCPIIDGGDQITLILTFIFIFLSFNDTRINGWKEGKTSSRFSLQLVNYFALLLAQLQMSVLYLNAFTEKLKVEEWLNGTVTYYWFTHNTFGFPSWCRQYVAHLMFNKYIVTSITWGTLVLELLLFAALFMSQHQKKILFVFAIVFHLGIALIHGLPSFLCAMAGGLMIYLLPLYKNAFQRNATYQS